MIQRALIHVDGPPGAGKTAFVERLVAGCGHWVLAVRCRRDTTLRRPREACPVRHPELRRYRAAGASADGLFTFPPGDLAADDLFTTRLLEDPAQAVVLEGDTPVKSVDLRVYVAPPLAPGRTLLIRQLRDHAREQQDKLRALQRLLDQPDGIQQWLAHTIGEPALALARQHPTLLEEARANLQAGIDKARTAAPPKPSEHWAIAASHAGIEHAGLVVVNLTDRVQRDRAQALLAELNRLRTDRQVFDDVLGWRGTRTPITAVTADLSDPKDSGTRKAVSRTVRTIRSASHQCW
jgi:hypothetical protein